MLVTPATARSRTIEGRGFLQAILDLDVLVDQIGEPELGDIVIKSGRTTGLTFGRVTRSTAALTRRRSAKRRSEGRTKTLTSRGRQQAHGSDSPCATATTSWLAFWRSGEPTHAPRVQTGSMLEFPWRPNEASPLQATCCGATHAQGFTGVTRRAPSRWSGSATRTMFAPLNKASDYALRFWTRRGLTCAGAAGHPVCARHAAARGVPDGR